MIKNKAKRRKQTEDTHIESERRHYRLSRWNLWKLWQFVKITGLFSVAVYTPNSDPISDVHWLVRRKIGSAVRGCAKLVDIRTCIENDRLVTSLVYCAIYAQLLVLRALGGASYSTGIILVVVRMAAPPAITSSALAHLVHRQWFIMHPWTRVDRWGTGGGRVPTLFIHACVDYAG